MEDQSTPDVQQNRMISEATLYATYVFAQRNRSCANDSLVLKSTGECMTQEAKFPRMQNQTSRPMFGNQLVQRFSSNEAANQLIESRVKYQESLMFHQNSNLHKQAIPVDSFLQLGRCKQFGLQISNSSLNNHMQSAKVQTLDQAKQGEGQQQIIEEYCLMLPVLDPEVEDELLKCGCMGPQLISGIINSVIDPNFLLGGYNKIAQQAIFPKDHYTKTISTLHGLESERISQGNAQKNQESGLQQQDKAFNCDVTSPNAGKYFNNIASEMNSSLNIIKEELWQSQFSSRNQFTNPPKRGDEAINCQTISSIMASQLGGDYLDTQKIKVKNYHHCPIKEIVTTSKMDENTQARKFHQDHSSVMNQVHDSLQLGIRLQRNPASEKEILGFVSQYEINKIRMCDQNHEESEVIAQKQYFNRTNCFDLCQSQTECFAQNPNDFQNLRGHKYLESGGSQQVAVDDLQLGIEPFSKTKFDGEMLGQAPSGNVKEDSSNLLNSLEGRALSTSCKRNLQNHTNNYQLSQTKEEYHRAHVQSENLIHNELIIPRSFLNQRPQLLKSACSELSVTDESLNPEDDLCSNINKSEWLNKSGKLLKNSQQIQGGRINCNQLDQKMCTKINIQSDGMIPTHMQFANNFAIRAIFPKVDRLKLMTLQQVERSEESFTYNPEGYFHGKQEALNIKGNDFQNSTRLIAQRSQADCLTKMKESRPNSTYREERQSLCKPYQSRSPKNSHQRHPFQAMIKADQFSQEDHLTNYNPLQTKVNLIRPEGLLLPKFIKSFAEEETNSLQHNIPLNQNDGGQPLQRNQTINKNESKQTHDSLLAQQLMVVIQSPSQFTESQKLGILAGYIESIKSNDVRLTFRCEFCEDRAYTRKNRLKIHILQYHLLIRKLYPCQFLGCNTVVSEKGNLRVHYRTHSHEYPYQCKFCSKRFISQGNQADHERRHQKIKPYACQYCHKRYYREYLLKNHTGRNHQEISGRLQLKKRFTPSLAASSPPSSPSEQQDEQATQLAGGDYGTEDTR
ncbi:hypothetical protein FGO68_gene15467 [Halteria grandinella]|uniref:C2H2-type domain-containing protein n=1 Tax=Halteria grandinella TaxID=5974 RepID=A0A8J8NGJ2_HALGN|nr:hypothetical protein FGO68_gene15467 [Halteria grandinella]